MHKELAYWLSIGIVAIVSIALFKVVAAKVGNRVPVLADFAAFV